MDKLAAETIGDKIPTFPAALTQYPANTALFSGAPAKS